MAKIDPSPVEDLHLNTGDDLDNSFDITENDSETFSHTELPPIPGITAPTTVHTADPDAVSEFKPDPADVEAALAGNRKPGRKPKQVQASGEREKIIIPTPPYRKFHSDANNRGMRTSVLWAWAESLPNWLKAKLVWYVYREHPVLRELTDEEKKAGKVKNIDKVAVDGPLAIHDDNDLLNRFGCGNYKVMLSGEGTGEIATGWVLNLGGGQYRDHPPTDRRVSDPKEVDWSNANNAAYAAFCRSNGTHPELVAQKETEADMAQATAISELVKSQGETNSRLFAIAEKAMEKKGNGDDSTGKALEVMADAAKKSSELAMDTVTRVLSRVNELTQANNQVQPQADPMEMISQVLRLIKEIQPKTTGESEELKMLRQELADARNQQLGALLDEVKELRKANAQAQATQVAAAAPKSIVEQIREAKELIEEVTGGKDDDDAGNLADEAPRWLRPILPVALPVLGMIAQRYLGIGGPIPGMPNPQPQYQPQPQQTPSMFPQIPASPQPQQMQPQTQPQPVQNGPQPVQQPVPTPIDQVTQVITLIAPGIKTHLTEGKSGAEFAGWFMDGFGEDGYDEIVNNFDAEMVRAALYSHPGLGSALQQFPAQQVEKFVVEFMTNSDDQTPVAEPVAVTPIPNGGGDGNGGGAA